MYATTKIRKMADSAMMRHAIPTMPRLGSTHGGSTCELIGIVLVVCIIRIPCPGLLDV
jgi:hypothetical protein